MEIKADLLTKTGRRIALVVLCGVAFLALLPGCGLTRAQKEGVSFYAKASSALGAASAEHLRAFRSDIVRMKTTRLAIEGRKLPATRPDGKPPDRRFYTEELNLDSGLDPDNLEKRLTAVDMLAAYGDLLQTLSGKSQEEEVTSAAERFANSVRNFPESPLPEEKVDNLGKLLATAGTLWTEGEKKKTVQVVVPQVSPLIQHLCDSLENDFKINGSGFAANVDLVQDRLASEAIDGLKGETTSMTDRLLLIDGLALANDSKGSLARVSSKMFKAIASLRQADRELVALVTERQFTLDAIKSYSMNVNDLVKAIKPFTKR
jgi:hypothetical protein